MKNFLYLSLLLLVVACKPANDLEAKKAELAKYRTQMDELKNQIAQLEKEIAKLDTSSNQKKAKLVTIAPVSRLDFNHYVDIQGAVESDQNIAVQPGMPGVVMRVNVKEGDAVSVGTILAETDNRSIRENI